MDFLDKNSEVSKITVPITILPCFVTYLKFILCANFQVSEELVKDAVESNDLEIENDGEEEDIDDAHFSIGSSKFEMKLDKNTVSKNVTRE